MKKQFSLVALILLVMTTSFMAQENAKKPEVSLKYKLRIARPTDNLEKVVKFYRDGLGLDVLFSFNHLGYEGEILGRKGSPYHLEFLHQRGRKVGKAPTQDNLLVFYMPDAERTSAVERMRKHGYEPVSSYNPFWNEWGTTFEDVDGYRVVLAKDTVNDFRVARPSDNLSEVVRFYRDGLGLESLGSFENHKGFDGVFFGQKGAPFHLEFTHHRGTKVGNAPTHENLLVFFIPDKTEWQEAVERMKKNGYQPVIAENPWGNTEAKTFEDIDGYRVVLKNIAWTL